MQQYNYDNTVQLLRRLRCPTHNLPAEISTENGELNVKACCDSFRDTVANKFFEQFNARFSEDDGSSEVI